MLISARMLEIVKHLYQYKTTTYKEIEQSLGIKERNVRYDVDRINEILADNGLEQIERKGKGVLESLLILKLTFLKLIMSLCIHNQNVLQYCCCIFSLIIKN